MAITTQRVPTRTVQVERQLLRAKFVNASSNVNVSMSSQFDSLAAVRSLNPEHVHG